MAPLENNLERFLQLMFFLRSLKYKNKFSRVAAVKVSPHKLEIFPFIVFVFKKKNNRNNYLNETWIQ